MLLKFALVVISSVSHSLLVEGTNTRKSGEKELRRNYEPLGSNYVRKTKKEKSGKDEKGNWSKDSQAFNEYFKAEDEEIVSDEESSSTQKAGSQAEAPNPGEDVAPTVADESISTADEEESSPTEEIDTTERYDDTDVTLSYTPDFRIGLFDQWKKVDSEWNHGATAVSSKNSTFTFHIPEETKVGDFLFLFLSRSDNFLPLRIDDWTRAAECFKTYNRQESCMTAAHCVVRDGPFCLKFIRGNEVGDGKDLATVVFYRKVTIDDPYCWTIDLPGRTISWAIVTSIPGVNEEDPIRRVTGRSCDAEWESVFPSVYGETNDVLLLSQSFDDTALKKDFKPPESTDLLEWTMSFDEAGFLFGKELNETGTTGDLATGGDGGPKCKDVLLSLTVNRGV